MSGNKIKSIGVALSFALALSAISLTGCHPKDVTYPEDGVKEYYSVERYTDSDYLISADGKPSAKTIKKFSEEVKAAKSGSAFFDLAGVVPLEYLESEKENAEFYYNGLEYGFYLAKEGDIFDLLLIDFDYTSLNFEHMRVVPILQQSFKRVALSEGGYSWNKYSKGSRKKYYMTNPRFLTVLQNENMRNYGDIGYSKADDTGDIIYQVNLTYDNLSAANGKLSEKLETFDAQMLVHHDYFDFKDAERSKGIVSEIFRRGGAEDINLKDNNSYTFNTKSVQIDDPDCSGFTRVVGVATSENVLLSADNGAFMQFSVIVSDGQSKRTRITRLCDFDIVARTNSGKPERVRGDGDDGSFTISNRLILRDEDMITVGGKDFEKEIIQVGILPHGDQSILFTPEYSGTYGLDFNSGFDKIVEVEPLGLKFEDANIGVTVDLKGGTTYTFKIYHQNETIQSDFQAHFSYSTVKKGDNSVHISGNNGGDTILNLKELQTDVYKFTAPSTLSYKILNEKFEEIDSGSTGVEEFYIAENYYLLIHNPSSEDVDVNLNITPVGLSDAGKDYAVEGGTTVYYKFKAEKTSAYAITVVGADAYFKLTYYNYAGALRPDSGQDVETYNFALNENEEIWIKVSCANSATIRFEATTQEYTFVIDGEEILGSSVWLSRGSEHSIKLTAEGKEIEGLTFSMYHSPYCQISYGGTLVINANAPLSQGPHDRLIEVSILKGNRLLSELTVFVRE